MEYSKRRVIKHYTYSEIFGNAKKLKEKYICTKSCLKKGRFEIFLILKPTDTSPEYTVKLLAQINSPEVRIYVANPKINPIENGKVVPHLFSDGSLCLYYPKNNEFKYSDSWADTIIPWTSLWLFYYEIWKETDEWLGGGIHNNECTEPA